jgi:hypothetical protein
MEHLLFTQLRTAKKKIIYLLEKSEASRDDDSRLYALYLTLELGEGDKQVGINKLKNMTAFDFVVNIASHEFINYASLIRARRLIQADSNYSHLRGTKYEERAIADNYFRNNINHINNDHD